MRLDAILSPERARTCWGRWTWATVKHGRPGSPAFFICSHFRPGAGSSS